MAFYLFTWDFRTPDHESEARDYAEICATKGKVRAPWSTGNTNKIKRGDIAFMLRQGWEPRGIIGTGIVHSKVAYPGFRYYENKKKKALLVDIDWTNFAVEPLIGTAELKRRFKFYWDPRRGGISLPAQIGKTLAKELQAQLKKKRKIRPTASETFLEGAVRRVERNEYERDLAARQQCIAHYGRRCSICDITFLERYGPEADGLIHVHHLVPIGGKRTRKTNPLRDLRPVCPNCHLVIHRRDPPYTIPDVKRMLKRQTVG